MKFRICFISFEYPPFIIGGAGVYAGNLALELSKLGHEVHVLAPSVDLGEKNDHKDLIIHPIDIVKKPFLSIASFWFHATKAYSQIQKDSGSFEILHGNAISDFSLSNLQVTIPRVVTVHHLGSVVARRFSFSSKLKNITGEFSLAPLIEKKVLTRANKIIAVSNYTKNTIISEYKIAPTKIEAVYNGTNLYQTLPSNQRISDFKRIIGLENNFTFLYVGRLNDPRKNLFFLLDAFRIVLKKRREPAKLLLVGPGDQVKLRQKASSLGISKDLIFLGKVDDETLKNCYSSCDVLVSPSLLEGFGLTLLEAMAIGKPVITFKVGAVPEIIKNNVNGKIVDKFDVDEFAEAMIFFQENSDITKIMGVANRKYVSDNFSWKKTAQLTERVYYNLLKSKMS